MNKVLTIALATAVVASAATCRKAPAPAAAASTSAAQTAPSATPGPPKPMPEQLPDVLARVNGEDVKKAEFDMLIRNMELGQGPIPAERRNEILRGALDRLITYTLLSQEVKARNIAVSDAEVEERMKAMRTQFPSEDAFKKALDDRKMTLERLRSDAKIDMSINKMMESELSTTPGASDAEVKEFYEKNPDKFKQGESVRASHILILADEKADAATKKQARSKIDAILKKVKAGEDFAKLAKENSQDGSAQQGGDLNYFGRGQMVPPFEQAAFSLKPGEVSDVVTTQYGYHIIKVTDHKAASTVPLEQVTDRIKQFLSEQKKQQRAEAFIAGLKQKSKIEVLV